MLTVHKYVRSLGVVASDVEALVGVAESHNQIAVVVFKSSKSHVDFLKKYEGRRMEVLEKMNVEVIISDKSVIEKYVRVGNLPPNLSLGVVMSRFSAFGKIKKLEDIRWEMYQNKVETEIFPCKTGWLVIKMSVDTNIPSYVSVGSYRAIVRYHGQTRTCRECDSTEHLWERCPQNKRNQQNLPQQQLTRVELVPPTPPEPQAQRAEETPAASSTSLVQTPEPSKILIEETQASVDGEDCQISTASSGIPAGQNPMAMNNDESESSQDSVEIPIPPLTQSQASPEEDEMEVEVATQKRAVQISDPIAQSMIPRLEQTNKKFKPNLETIKKLDRKKQ